MVGPLLFRLFINDLPLHVTGNMVNCEMFVDDTTLDASNTVPVMVENELQKSINEVSDWCSKNAMVLHPAKTESVLLATRQKQQLRPLNLSLKADHIEQVQEHRHLDVIIDDDSTASHTLHMYARQSKKKKSVPNASYFIMLTFLLIILMPPLSGMVVVIFYSKKLILFVGELQSGYSPIHSQQQKLSYSAWVYSRSERKLCSIRLY